jgi:hypothetical protein
MFDHVKGPLVHVLYWMQSKGQIQIPLLDFKSVILDSTYQKSEAKRPNTWYTLTCETFLNQLYNVRIHSQLY